MPVDAEVPRSATLCSSRFGIDSPSTRTPAARHLVDEAAALLVGAGDQIEQSRVQHHRREQLTAGLEHLDVGRAEVARFTVCTTSTPIVTSRTTSGAAISDAKRSSPVSGKNLKLGCCWACSTASGEPVSATSPTRPSPTARWTRPIGFRCEPLGRAQRELLALGLRQVDRAHVGVESLGDPVDDVAQRLGEIVRTGHDPGDVG